MRRRRLGKLTVSMGPSDIRGLKGMAARDGMSLSAWLRRVVRARFVRKKDPLGQLPPITRGLVGIIPDPKGRTDRELIDEALAEKYGL